MVSKHDKLIDIIARHTRDDVEFKWKNVEYGYDHKVLGEVDIMMLRNGVLFMFEIKSSQEPYLKRKARYQLDRAANKIPEILQRDGYNISKILKFYVAGIKGGYNYKMRVMKDE